MSDSAGKDQRLSTAIHQALGMGAALTEAQKTSIYDIRAQQRAQPITDAERSAGDTLRVLSFHLGQEHYAFPAASVTSVSKSIAVAPVPCVPNFVAGITNLRGHIRSVVNLASYLGLPLEAAPDYVVVAQYDDIEVAFLVSELHEVTDVPVKNIKPRPQVGTGAGHAYVQGIVPGGLILLDLIAIFTDERFIINDEVI